MNRYRVGIIGLGRIASLYEKDTKARKYYPYLTHAGTFSRHPQTQIVCASDTNAFRRKDFERRWRVHSLYADYEEMLAKEAIDILCVCTTPEHHDSIIQKAAGKVPLIFCEKPMGNSLREAQRIDRLCQKTGTRLSVNLYRLFDPSHQAVGRRIQRGDIGAIQRVNCYYGKGLRNSGTHLISLLQSYFGRIAAVRTDALRVLGDTSEPIADFTAVFESGVPCSVQSCDFRNYRLFEMDILGKTGRITLDREGFGFRFFQAQPHRAQMHAKELRTVRSPIQSTVGRAFFYAADNLVSSLRTGRRPLSSSKEYLQTERVVAAVIDSAKRDRWVRVTKPWR